MGRADGVVLFRDPHGSATSGDAPLVADVDGGRFAYVTSVRARGPRGARRFEAEEPGELYALDVDPRQETDLAGQRPQLARELRERLVAWYRGNDARAAIRDLVERAVSSPRDLLAAIDRGEFRADLYYRISSFPIRLPPLRGRRSDIPLLAEHFVRLHAERLGKKIEAISAKMLDELAGYDWPGNVRELDSIIERAVISTPSGSVLELPGPLRLIASSSISQSKSALDAEHDAGLSSVERTHIVNVLEQTGWQIAGAGGAASVLGIPASTLRSKMKRLGIRRPQS